MDGAHCIPSPEDETSQSTAFTVTFESAKSANNRFIKRHIRNLSLPVVKVYDHKVEPTAVNGNERSKKPGNHSEGYFSSDPEDEHGNPKMAFIKHENSPTKEESSEEEEEEEEENRSEGAPSEAGTYTIDKETPDVIMARLSIDTKFGVQAKGGRDSKEWVSDWASRALPGPSSASSLLPTKTKSSLVSKIPSPISPRARLGSRGQKPVTPVGGKERSRPNSPNAAGKEEAAAVSATDETERYLKTTERAMTVLAARMSLSLDSGGESDNGGVGEGRRSRPLQRSDSSASESHKAAGAPASSRYNRAFSLRRGRLEDGPKKIESLPVKPLTPRSSQPPTRVAVKPVTSQQNSLSRTDITRNSIRASTNQRSPQLSMQKTDFGKKKPGPGGSARSNSSLSSKEVDFQNWKRRKSYDPMKAAAEGKKKEAAAKRPGPPSVMSQSSTNATTTPKSPVNSVLRSASFHTTRQLSGAPQSSSEEEEEDEEEDMTLSAEDWPQKLVSQMTVENVPGGSRGSLYSNNSSGGSPRQRKLEGIDNFIVSAIATISNRVYTNTAIILNKLRFIFDEESEKYKELTAELELLEAGSEASSSPSKSTSRDLAVTLKNLKRLDSAIKVLNDVLFENIEYE